MPYIQNRLLLVSLLLTLTSCGFSKAEAESPTQRPQPQAVSVDVAIARSQSLQQDLEYTGTTVPFREVSLRSQIEGRLLSLQVDVGDLVQQGQVLGQLDSAISAAAVIKAQADVATGQSEVAQAEAAVGNARTEAQRARIELQQAQRDAGRLQQLSLEGAITAQEAELAQTEVLTAEQAVRSAEAQIRTQQQAVAAAQGRVAAQQAIVVQEQERQSYAVLTAPVTGLVLSRTTEPGNLAQAGSEILKIGDFSQVKIAVQVSELELATVRVGRSAQVRLDAFPDRQIQGRVTRISPAADPTARLVPVEITIPNEGAQLSSGLLARVNFSAAVSQRVVVPQTAIQLEAGQENPQTGKLFVVTEPNSQPTLSPTGRATPEANRSPAVPTVEVRTVEVRTVKVRNVRLGKQVDGQVEILSGLQPGEQFVARSSRALKDGEAVKLSFLSETNQSRTN
ncbi:MAG: efflux RND transporter periplasmic adaptor subunit [Leptolyngbyaceae cyanobacterium CRU_2_3]|nr:efflux RND transporter periplasmic adaptor subunit [Leptolyngbyaceae cyanobacterium CRU_2_3]